MVTVCISSDSSQLPCVALSFHIHASGPLFSCMQVMTQEIFLLALGHHLKTVRLCRDDFDTIMSIFVPLILQNLLLRPICSVEIDPSVSGKKQIDILPFRTVKESWSQL